MAITVTVNSIDRTNLIIQTSLSVTQNLTSQVDTASFMYRKYGSRTFVPAINDTVEITDDAGSTIFSGKIQTIDESVESVEGVKYSVKCVDHTDDLINTLFSASYSSDTVGNIIADIITNYMSGFTTVNVNCNVTIDKIVFNQVSVFKAIKRLADIVRFQWYVDENKDIHFFPKFTKTAPYNLTDTSGNYIYKSLRRKIDGSQIVNKVIVRGGEYDGSSYTDVITVKGNDSKSFKLPYKMANLTVELDTGAGYSSQTVGVDFIDDFTTKDVLYNFNDKTIRFQTALSDNDKIRFSGNPKVRVLAIAEDTASQATYGVRGKLIRDNSIEDLNVARQRASGEITAYKDAVSNLSFSTYTAGLRAGMVINLNSTIRNTTDDYIIKTVKFSFHDNTRFKYTVQVVTTEKYGLIELLQRLLEPDSALENENEVAEKLETNIDTINITELITNVTPEQDFTNLTLIEDIQDNPLGANTEPFYVLAPYFPSSHSDTKRVGYLDNSLQVY